jgi:outer membrane receptor protein involved in Fe transport
MYKLFIFLFAILIFQVGLAQKSSKIIGKLIDTKNNSIANATISIDGKSIAKTDNDGRFDIALLPKVYNIIITAVGYTEIAINAIVKQNEVTDLDVIVLQIVPKKGDDVVVRGNTLNTRKESISAGISFIKNNNTVASIVTSEAIKKSPDATTGDVVKRMPGASIQEGKFLVIRGLADRYNQAVLNGVLLTSTEPDRKTFSFDLIPSAMLDNLIVNKAFLPEMPGEWAGGLVQVNTKDIPNKNFFSVQLGTGFNSQSIGKTFYHDNAGKLDWLGIETNTRALPTNYKTKSKFDLEDIAVKTEMGKSLRNAWAPQTMQTPLNAAVQINGGFVGRLFGKKVGGMVGLNYNKRNRILDITNSLNTLSSSGFSLNYSFEDDKYQQDVQLGALASFTMQLNNKHKIGLKAITNINTSNFVTQRIGFDLNRDEDLKGTEITFKQNSFFTTQLHGDHSIAKNVKAKWYGAFNILDSYVPDQRRILYGKTRNTSNQYSAIISNVLSQQSGSRIFLGLSDYIYTGGGDVTYTLKNKQTIKGGYMLQIRDRLYDAKLFANYLPSDNLTLRNLSADKIFAPENFGNGTNNKFAFNAIKGNTFRYMANTILNAGYVQADNELWQKLRLVYGVRVEHFDQLVGSVYTWDPRHTYSKVLDVLPGLNATLKTNSKTNIRFSASQTVIRPELRELASLNLYDFELNASIQGNTKLKRTKVTNVDTRFEYYNKPGEILTIGAFYKNFNSPIEQLFNEGAGGSSTFNYQNPSKAYSTGFEVEFRKKLDFIATLKNFTFQTNAAYIKSLVKDAKFNLNRSLQGQSPYIINTGLFYDNEKNAFNISVLYNRIGERIFLVGDISAGSGSPDIYEAPRDVMDIQFSKKLIKSKAEVKLNISDVFNQTQNFYQNGNTKKTYQKGVDALRFSRKYGTNFGITFNYSL